MKTINELYEKYTGYKALILGNGQSIDDYKPLNSTITVGVNDINKKLSPDYHLLVDSTNRFAQERVLNIQKSESPHVITQIHKGWDFGERQYFFKLGAYANFSNLIYNDMLDYGLDSPYMAAMLAFKMGIRVIGFLGVDYTPGHFYNPEDGHHQLVRVNKVEEVKRLYALLNEEFSKRRVKVFNLNKFSKIDTMPYLSIDDFDKIKV